MKPSTYCLRAATVAVLSLTATAWVQAACYTVYNAKNEAIYRSTESPVDLSKPLHESQNALPAGSRLVFTPNNEVCVSEINELNPQEKPARNANMVTDQLNIGSLITAQ